MRRYLYLGLVLLLVPYAWDAAAKKKPVSKSEKSELVEYIDALGRDSLLRHASWSIRVVDLDNGSVVVSHNEQASLIPASNMKVVTTGAALLLLGPDYRFTTTLSYDGEITADSTLCGNLYVAGGGDPSLGSSVWPATSPDSVFRVWTAAIKAAGIKKITGSVNADVTGVFDDSYRSLSWNWGDIALGYGAGTNPLQFADNRFRISLTAGAAVGDEAYVSPAQPYVPGCVIENRTVTTRADSAFDVDILSSPYSSRVIVTGGVPMGKKRLAINAAMPDPALACVWHFDSHLRSGGIATSGNIGVCRTKPDSVARRYTILVYPSPPLSELISETNKNSNNCYAESLLKIIGYEKSGTGSTKAGARAISQLLRQKGMGKDSGFNQADGSGISRKNFITTAFMCDYLLMMSRSEQFAAFHKSLPVAGVDGTMKNLMRGQAGEKRVAAKSGTMEFVRGYSGYVTTRGGHRLCFSVVFNNYLCPATAISRRLCDLMNLMAAMD